MNFQTKTKAVLLTFFLGILTFFPTSLEGQNRKLIGKQLQQSISPYSIVVTDASNNQAYTIPGAEGTVLSISSGIPTWVSPSAASTNIYNTSDALDANRTVTLATFTLNFDDATTRIFMDGDNGIIDIGDIDNDSGRGVGMRIESDGDGHVYIGDVWGHSLGTQIHIDDDADEITFDTPSGSAISTGDVEFTNYGIGNYTATTETYLLNVDANGFVGESPLGGGTSADNGVSLSGATVQLGHAATGTGASDFTANRYLYTGAFDLEVGSSGAANAFYIDGSTGMVGINNPTPTYQLDIGSSSSRLYNSTGFADFFIMSQDATWNTGVWLGYQASTHNSGLEADFGDADVNLWANSNITTTFLGTGQVQFPDYGSGTFNDTDDIGVISYDASGNLQEMTFSELTDSVGGGGGADTNYAEDNLTADANRSHTWTTFNQTETYTTGDFKISNTGDTNAFFIDGSTGYIGMGTAAPTFDLEITKNVAATDAVITLNNSDSNALSDAEIRVISEGTTGGEAKQNFRRGSVTWSFGIDNDGIDAFSVADGNNLNTEYLRVLATGQWVASLYGSGTFTGTAAYNLSVDASGNIIETAAGGGDGNGIYDGNGTVPSSTVATLTDDITFTGGQVIVQAASSGGTPGIDSDDFFIEGTGDNGMTILGGTGVGDNAVISMGSSSDVDALKFSVNGTSTLAAIGTTNAVSSLLLTSGAGLTAITCGTGQNLQFNDYGSGSNTGTATYLLAVTAAGNVIEENVSGYGVNIYNSDGTLTADRTLDMNGSTRDLLIGDIAGGDEMSIDIVQAGQIEMRYLKGSLNSEIGILSSGTSGDIYINLQDGAKDNNMTFTDTTWDHDMDDGSTKSIGVTYSLTSPSAAWVLADGATVNTFTINEDRTDIGGQFATTGKISATLTANQNDWSPTGIGSTAFIRIDGNAAYNITGINTANWTDGTRITICNFDSADDFTFMHEDVLSTATNRFDLKSDGDYILLDGACIDIIYDQTSGRIRIIE